MYMYIYTLHLNSLQRQLYIHSGPTKIYKTIPTENAKENGGEMAKTHLKRVTLIDINIISRRALKKKK